MCLGTCIHPNAHAHVCTHVDPTSMHSEKVWACRVLATGLYTCLCNMNMDSLRVRASRFGQMSIKMTICMSIHVFMGSLQVCAWRCGHQCVMDDHCNFLTVLPDQSARTHARTHVRTHARTHARAHASMCARMHVRTCAWACTRVGACFGCRVEPDVPHKGARTWVTRHT